MAQITPGWLPHAARDPGTIHAFLDALLAHEPSIPPGAALLVSITRSWQTPHPQTPAPHQHPAAPGEQYAFHLLLPGGGRVEVPRDWALHRKWTGALIRCPRLLQAAETCAQALRALALHAHPTTTALVGHAGIAVGALLAPGHLLLASFACTSAHARLAQPAQMHTLGTHLLSLLPWPSDTTLAPRPFAP